jgi:hypothetical protein
MPVVGIDAACRCKWFLQIGDEARAVATDRSIVRRYAPDIERDRESYTEVWVPAIRVMRREHSSVMSVVLVSSYLSKQAFGLCSKELAARKQNQLSGPRQSTR